LQSASETKGTLLAALHFHGMESDFTVWTILLAIPKKSIEKARSLHANLSEALLHFAANQNLRHAPSLIGLCTQKKPEVELH
jgi:hypothetical protein